MRILRLTVPLTLSNLCSQRDYPIFHARLFRKKITSYNLYLSLHLPCKLNTVSGPKGSILSKSRNFRLHASSFSQSVLRKCQVCYHANHIIFRAVVCSSENVTGEMRKFV